MFEESQIPITALKPRKPSKRPATASARMDGKPTIMMQKSSTRTINNNHKLTKAASSSTIATAIGTTSVASTSLGNSQLIQHMKLMGIYNITNETEKKGGNSTFSQFMTVDDPSNSTNFLNHRRSASFLELVDRSSYVKNDTIYNLPDSPIDPYYSKSFSDEDSTTNNATTTERVNNITESIAIQSENESSVELDNATVRSCGSQRNKDRDSGGDENTYLVLSQAFARIAELESTLEYYERACVDATVDCDFWQKEYNRLYDFIRNAEEKEERLLSQIRDLEARLNGEGKELSNQKRLPNPQNERLNQNKRPISAATVISPLIDTMKGDSNCHSMLEIASSSASVTTTINEARTLQVATTIQKKQNVNGLARAVSNGTMKTLELAAFNGGSSTSTLTQRNHKVVHALNPLIAPILREKFGASGPEIWNPEKRKLISNWVAKAQAEIEGENKREKQIPIIKQSNVSPGIQAITEALYKGWTMETAAATIPEPIKTVSKIQKIFPFTDLGQKKAIPSNNERHPFSISQSDPALRARNAEQNSELCGEQSYEGLQAHTRWRTWRIQSGK